MVSPGVVIAKAPWGEDAKAFEDILIINDLYVKKGDSSFNPLYYSQKVLACKAVFILSIIRKWRLLKQPPFPWLEQAVQDSLEGKVGADEVPDMFSAYADTCLSNHHFLVVFYHSMF